MEVAVMRTEAAKAVWDTVGKAVVICVVTVLLIMWWTSERAKFAQPLPALVTPPTAFVPHSQVENDYLDVVNDVVPGVMTPGNEDDILAMGYDWCMAQANGIDPIDTLARVDEKYGEGASDLAATIMVAATAFLCPGEEV